MTSLDDVTHSTLIVMITVQSIFKPSRPSSVNYVTISLEDEPAGPYQLNLPRDIGRSIDRPKET